MLSVFILKSNSKAMQYGMGSYVRELTNAMLKHSDIIIYEVAYESSTCLEFMINEIAPRYFIIEIPTSIENNSQNVLNDSHNEKYALAVVHLLSVIIRENERVVFLTNSLFDFHIIKKLKEKYTYPVISVVHLASWQMLFKGNIRKLKDVDLSNPKNEIDLVLLREKEFFSISDSIISVTRYMKEYLVNMYGIVPDKIKFVPNGINYDEHKAISDDEKVRLKHTLGIRSDEVVILFTGRIDEHKGIFHLIEAMKEVCTNMDSLRLIIVGQGDINSCLNRCDNVYGKITFTGFLSHEKIKDFYKIADIGVVPSMYEQCPFTVLEMMAYEIPLVMANIEGLKEILNKNECLYVNPIIQADGNIDFNVTELADAILELLNNKVKSETLRKKCRKIVELKFSSISMAGEMLEVFNSLQGRRQNSS